MKFILISSIMLSTLLGVALPAVAQDFENSLFVINRSNEDVEICGPRIKRRTGKECRTALPRERVFWDDVIRTGPKGRATVRKSRFLYNPDEQFIQELGPNSGLSFGPQIDPADLPVYREAASQSKIIISLQDIEQFLRGAGGVGRETRFTDTTPRGTATSPLGLITITRNTAA